MNKILHLFLVVSILSLMSCEKEEQVLNEQASDQISNSLTNNEGAFKEEIVVIDENGQNSALFAVYSDDEKLLSSFLEANKFTLLVNKDDIATLKSTELSDYKQSNPSSNDFDLNQEPKIIIELVTANLKDDVKGYSLEVKQNQVKSTKGFLFGTPVGYITSSNFIGATHLGWGYEFVAKRRYKAYWYSSWKYETVNGANAWFVYPSGAYYISQQRNAYRNGLTIYPHLYQNTTNYRIAYSRDTFRGQNCTIGSYDGQNCYVGTAPSGTTAFLWPNMTGNFYYTPVNGNQCPRAGSYFDGTNCFVIDIPSSCEGFVYNNSWYVKTDVI